MFIPLNIKEKFVFASTFYVCYPDASCRVGDGFGDIIKDRALLKKDPRNEDVLVFDASEALLP